MNPEEINAFVYTNKNYDDFLKFIEENIETSDFNFLNILEVILHNHSKFDILDKLLIYRQEKFIDLPEPRELYRDVKQHSLTNGERLPDYYNLVYRNAMVACRAVWKKDRLHIADFRQSPVIADALDFAEMGRVDRKIVQRKNKTILLVEQLQQDNEDIDKAKAYIKLVEIYGMDTVTSLFDPLINP